MRKIYLIFLYLLLISCNKENIGNTSNNASTLINGDIPNLPDGVVYLYEEGPDNKIDSSGTSNGKFRILHNWKQNKQPSYIGIYHIDKKGIKRLFDFETNAKYKGAPLGVSVFYSDSLVTINGNFKENPQNEDFKLPANIKFVTGPQLKAGRQTEAFYNIDGDLFEKIDDKTAQVVKEKLKKYPYSYYLLYEINNNKNTFSAQQVKDFLQSFKGDITQSETFKKLSVYNQKRFIENKTALPILEDSKGEKSQILDTKFKKHVIIFWASWCGPCRMEIPMLKKVYGEYGKDIEFVSISIDSDKKAWTKALNEEQMKWKQLLVSDKDPAFESLQLQFKLNSAIPYTIIVDNNLKILSSSTGLSNEEEFKKMINK